MIDLEHLEKYVSGDVALRNEILSIFSEQARLLSGQFSDANSDEAWRNTAHALKGASRGVGAWVLGDLCEEAEQMIGAIAGKAEKRAAILVSIRQKVGDALTEADRLRAQAA
jgi:HPt (histidine-containing phosphotransfer) domain-containing protein